MARLAYLSIVNVPHHVTQRGNGRQFILAADAERGVYLDLLRKYVELYALSKKLGNFPSVPMLF